MPERPGADKWPCDLAVRIKQHQLISGRFEVGGVEVQLDAEFVVGQQSGLFVFYRRQIIGRPEYAAVSERLWGDVVGKKMYLTGGIGASGEYEAFGAAFDLPNAKAYAETCASVGSAFWNQRLFELTGDAKYVDILERVVFNGILPGVGLGGDRFFYPNPLESSGKYERSAWFEVACCPANVARFLPSFPGYFYATGGDAVYVNFFASGTARFELAGRRLEIVQETKYPWDGSVKMLVNPARPGEFTIMIRLPGWTHNRPARICGGVGAALGRRGRKEDVCHGRPRRRR